ncbi:hypothetical protein G5T42_08770 [Microbacterium sp. 4R-513]|uniref:hypothetical protein n=1 Tax=Microbacterium sp. 4R-513 TaxID=2567934 RepID=UPI0013E10604|nr:hypothetical protein [Microbacterium sp. 4R-513]QIG39569.1 hypothetical protein G5T42_08770 [Microbacterium sp. 4R-513]
MTFHLTFEGADELHAAAEAFGRRIGGEPAVDVVPLEWLHLTMMGIGSLLELDRDEHVYPWRVLEQVRLGAS